MAKKSFWQRGEDYAKKVSGEIIDQIKRGVAPWQKPWKPGEQISAENFSTGKQYTGGNSLYLMSRGIRDGRGDNRWGTYNQIREAGGQVRKGGEAFPSVQLESAIRGRGKNLTFEEEEIEHLVESKDRTFALLSLLYPFLDLQGHRFHIDHVFPKSRFSSRQLRRAGVADEDVPQFQDRVDRLPNLQLLVGEANESKSATLPRQWMSETFGARATEYAERHDLGDLPAEITGFNAFYEARRTRLVGKLRELLGADRRQ